ncbi:MAG: Ohr family peroxiredoxin [Nakamurella multipartita]
MAALSYTTTATAWGGRMGRVATSDGTLDYQLSMPESMGGEGGEGTNPEQLFAAGYAACFHNALRSVARKEKVDVTDSAVGGALATSAARPPTASGWPSPSRPRCRAWTGKPGNGCWTARTAAAPTAGRWPATTT